MKTLSMLSNPNSTVAAMVCAAIAIASFSVKNQEVTFLNYPYIKTTDSFFHNYSDEYDAYIDMHHFAKPRSHIMKTVHVCSDSTINTSASKSINVCKNSSVKIKRYVS